MCGVAKVNGCGVYLWVSEDGVLEGLLCQAKEVAPRHGPNRHRPVLREAQHAVLPEEAPLL